MRKYYVHYYKDFANTYRLFYTETEKQIASLPSEAHRISRKDAERLAREERERRKYDPSFSGYADIHIFPADAPWDEDDMRESKEYVLDGYIWRKTNENL